MATDHPLRNTDRLAQHRQLVSSPTFPMFSELEANRPDGLEEVDCPMCPDASKIPVYELEKKGRGKRTVVRCGQCNLLFVSPRIAREEITRTYSGRDYFERNQEQTGYRNYLQDRDLHLLFFRRQLAELENFAAKGRLLDVGCAGGFLVEEALRRGWQAEGVELSEYASEYARSTLGLNVQTGSLRHARFPNGQFDAVVMDDVIEHLENPLADVREVWRILKCGGVFFIHTPNAASPWRHLMGKHWIHLKPDEHLFYFTPGTITQLLEKAGFQVLSAKACSKATNANYIAGVIEKSCPIVARCLKALFSRFEFWFRPIPFRGGGMQVCARKTSPPEAI